MNTTAQNPFRALLNAQHSREVVVRVAKIVRAAHVESDVWAGCRVADSLLDMAGGMHASYLNGPKFADYVDAQDSVITDLDELREHAWTFLAQEINEPVPPNAQELRRAAAVRRARQQQG